MKSLLLTLLGVGVLGTAGWWSSTRLSGPGVATVTAAREDVAITIEAPGKLEAAIAYEIGPPSIRDAWNYNLEWMIPEGRRVKEGEVVARFDSSQIDDRLRTERANLETVLKQREREQRDLDASLRSLELDLTKARGELERKSVQVAVPDGLVSAIELKELEVARDLADRRVRFLQERLDFDRGLVEAKLDLLSVKQARHEQQIAYLEDAKAKHFVKAPTSGLVLHVPKQDGDRWEVGERVWMLAKILEIADVSSLRVAVEVLEVDAARLALGQSASVSIDALPGLEVESSIAEIGRLVRERSVQDRSKVFDAFLEVPEVDPKTMRPGMGVQVEITVEKLADRVTVPEEVLRPSEQGPVVEVLVDGERRLRPVTLGPRANGRVVVSSGLEEGDQVVLPGLGEA
ncbi:MAG: efflux RND transporter periplasmic adaptor subunit [Acidobacteriota bacterium]